MGKCILRVRVGEAHPVSPHFNRVHKKYPYCYQALVLLVTANHAGSICVKPKTTLPFHLVRFPRRLCLRLRLVREQLCARRFPSIARNQKVITLSARGSGFAFPRARMLQEREKQARRNAPGKESRSETGSNVTHVCFFGISTAVSTFTRCPSLLQVIQTSWHLIAVYPISPKRVLITRHMSSPRLTKWNTISCITKLPGKNDFRLKRRRGVSVAPTFRRTINFWDLDIAGDRYETTFIRYSHEIVTSKSNCNVKS